MFVFIHDLTVLINFDCYVLYSNQFKSGFLFIVFDAEK